MSYVENPPLDELMHYGMPRRSGRYPWGSGDDPYQHSKDFLGRVEELRKQGITYTDENGKIFTGDTAIAKNLGLTSILDNTSFNESYRFILDLEQDTEITITKEIF